MMLGRMFVTLAFAASFAVASNAEEIAADYLLRLDLNRRVDFERAETIDIHAVSRISNVFFIVADRATIGGLDRAGLAYQYLDAEPFTSGTYYFESPSTTPRAPEPASANEVSLGCTERWTLWKTDHMDAPRYGPAAKARYMMTPDEIPLSYMTPLIAALGTSDDPLIDSLAALISEDSILAYATRLQAFQTRYVYTDSNAAAESYLIQKFLSFGYTDVRTDTFLVSSQAGGHNIICTKHGTFEPDNVIVVGAHFDSFSQDSDPMIYAPGGDDNASGVAGVLEIARVVAGLPSQKTIVFIAFDGEEVGLQGSHYYAQHAAETGVDILLMLNMDMIGYNPDADLNVELNGDALSLAYVKLAHAYAETLGLIPETTLSPSSNSDHKSFSSVGYHTAYAAEGEFNYDGWHTNIDLVSRLDITYWSDVVRVIGMTAMAASLSPAPVDWVELWDVGDGQSLELRWAPCQSPGVTGYRVFVGASSEQYDDTLDVAGATTTSIRIDGLTQGTVYYATVMALGEMGLSSLVGPEASQSPELIPHAPSGFAATAADYRIDLMWDAALELDFSHYVLYRGTDSMSLAVYEPALTTAGYTDISVESGTRYYYRLEAHDADGYTSSPSLIVSAIPATFDQGTLVLAVTSSDTFFNNPSLSQQSAVYNTMFANLDYTYRHATPTLSDVDRSLFGQYEAIIWIDDDQILQRGLYDHLNTVQWYLSHGTDLAVLSWQSDLETPALIESWFGIEQSEELRELDCVGGIGHNGFPDVVFDTARVNEQHPGWNVLRYIRRIETTSPSENVILGYDSATDDPSREDAIVGLRGASGDSRLILAGLPLYYMRDDDGQAFVSSMMEWLNPPPPEPGDLNADGTVDALDLSALVDAIFLGMEPAAGFGYVDVNGDCVGSVLDLVYMIDYIFRGGPNPLEGCVN
jgi:hypothetical protein